MLLPNTIKCVLFHEQFKCDHFDSRRNDGHVLCVLGSVDANEFTTRISSDCHTGIMRSASVYVFSIWHVGLFVEIECIIWLWLLFPGAWRHWIQFLSYMVWCDFFRCGIEFGYYVLHHAANWTRYINSYAYISLRACWLRISVFCLIILYKIYVRLLGFNQICISLILVICVILNNHVLHYRI